MPRIRKFGPPGVARPFIPTPDFNGTMSVEDQKLETLEHIATSLSAIDNNIDLLTKTMQSFLQHYSKGS